MIFNTISNIIDDNYSFIPFTNKLKTQSEYIVTLQNDTV
jgi:hypothetical protein